MPAGKTKVVTKSGVKYVSRIVIALLIFVIIAYALWVLSTKLRVAFEQKMAA